VAREWVEPTAGKWAKARGLGWIRNFSGIWILLRLPRPFCQACGHSLLRSRNLGLRHIRAAPFGASLRFSRGGRTEAGSVGIPLALSRLPVGISCHPVHVSPPQPPGGLMGREPLWSQALREFQNRKPLVSPLGLGPRIAVQETEVRSLERQKPPATAATHQGEDWQVPNPPSPR